MKTEALKLALEALTKKEWEQADYTANASKAIHILEQALAQPEQEPNSVTYKEVTEAMNALYTGDSKQVQIAMMMESKKLYTTPPQRTAAEGEDTRRAWVGLTDEEVIQIKDDMTLDIRSHVDFYRHCEAKLKEKNT